MHLHLQRSGPGEASLSLGVWGRPPKIPSWGVILGEARLYIRNAPWMMFLPGMALTVTVLALNLMGDGIRDWLDPRLRKDVIAIDGRTGG